MARESKENKELWVRFALAAIENYKAPDDVDDADELVDDMCKVAADVADGMLDEYEERFAGTRGGRRTRKDDDE